MKEHAAYMRNIPKTVNCMYTKCRKSKRVNRDINKYI
jgi:hypothetical protein